MNHLPISYYQVGCLATWPNKWDYCGTIESILNTDGGKIVVNDGIIIPIEEAKPVLRRMDSMTTEEQLKFGWDTMAMADVLDAHGFDRSRYFLIDGVEHYIKSLIDAGLAVDAATL